jgi:geranylgeranyl diphosphate synthase type I
MSKGIENTPLLQTMKEAIEGDLRHSLLLLPEMQHSQLGSMISYHLGWEGKSGQAKGKRIRPLLTLLCCAATGGDWTAALPAASAIELIHNFSLIHDDIEDHSEIRRGRVTVWKQWGIPKAINVGDAVFILSHLISHRLREKDIPSDTILDVLRCLDEACLELTIGQQMDLEFEEIDTVTVEAYLKMIHGKTSALLSAATACGGLIAQAHSSSIESLRSFGRHLGLAFQIRDDILGIWGKPAVTGKSIGDDLRSRKKTLPIIYGLNYSKPFNEKWKSAPESDQAIQSMREILEQSNAQQFAEENARTHTHSAQVALNAFPGQEPYITELSHLTETLLNRER